MTERVTEMVTEMDLTHEQRLTEVEQRSKSNTRIIDEIKKRQDNLDELVSTVKVLAEKEKNVESDIKEIKSDVKSLTSKSGQRWDTMIDKVIVTIVAAIIAYILTQIGL